MLAELSAPLVALGLLIVATEVVGGWRVFGPDWQGGDLLYHSALANAILRGELPPGGAYPGLPAYYPPGFHADGGRVHGRSSASTSTTPTSSSRWSGCRSCRSARSCSFGG